jgi:arylsulfatase A-like enzyme
MYAIVTALLLGCLFFVQSAAAARPNVILILTDDQGYGDLACHGNPILKTPNLDCLQAESVRLTNFHVDPACAPTRAALMTGRYSHRVGVWHVVLNPSVLRTGERTMAEVFAANGYRTALFGKWHLGDNYPYRPQDRGFQEVITFGGGVVGHTPDYWLNDYVDDHYLHNGRWEKFPGYCTDMWFQQAIRFARARRDSPFFIYLAVNAPHAPLQVPQPYLDRYPGLPEKTQRFYAMISCIDDNIGRLRAALKEARLDENTLLIFMTDNGSTDKTFNAGMRGNKASPYEGGHRVPCFLHWPAGGLHGGRDVPALTAHFDLLPTLIGLCGLKTPTGGTFDGADLTPLLRGRTNTWPERTLVVEWQGEIKPVQWQRSAVMTDRWRLINGEELHDMQAAPDQSQNVAAKHPAVVNRLRQAYERWWAEVSARDDELKEIPIGAQAANPVRLTAYDWINQTGRQADMPWAHVHIVAGPLQNGYWPLRVEQAGRYEIRLRRWPEESGLAINDLSDAIPPEKSWHPVEGANLLATSARVAIQDHDQSLPVSASAHDVAFTVALKPGPARLQTWFRDDAGRSRGAYYVTVRRLGGD